MLEVRDAVENDIKTIVDFQIRMAYETEKISLDNTLITKGVQAVFDDHTKGHYYIAEKNNKIAGSLLTTYEWSDWRNGYVVWLQSVYVVPEFRANGVFRSLFDHINKLVVEKPEYMGIRLYVDNTNLIAQKVYNSVKMNGEHYTLFEKMN